MRMKINKKIIAICIMLVSCIFMNLTKVYAEIIVYHEVVKKSDYENLEELKPIKMIDLEKSKDTFIDKILSNKWYILYIAIAVVVIFITIIVISAIKKRRYGR